MSIESISSKDRARLRELAQTQLKYSQLPIMRERNAEWLRHAAFRPGRPMIHLEIETFEQEIIPEQLHCETKAARDIERQLLSNFLNYELFDDDRVVPDYFAVCSPTFFTLFGLEITEDFATASDGSQVGRRFNTIIGDLHDDWSLLGKTRFGYLESKEETHRRVELLTELFGDILPVRMKMNCLRSCPTQLLVHMMGMETMFFSMCDYPDEFLTLMDRIADDTIAYFDWLVQEQLLLPTIGNECLGNGSFCYTDELPGRESLAERPFTTRDVWGFMDSQETVAVSPDMFEELVFPCYRKIAAQFGLLSYGCCEPVNSVWDNCLSKLPNLRKLSISPWCDEEFMGERLRGQKTIYFRKPSPNFIGLDTVLDEDAFRAHMKKTMLAARGCQLEIAQRDVYTIHGNIPQARRYVQIIRECAEQYWKP